MLVFFKQCFKCLNIESRFKQVTVSRSKADRLGSDSPGIASADKWTGHYGLDLELGMFEIGSFTFHCRNARFSERTQVIVIAFVRPLLNFIANAVSQQVEFHSKPPTHKILRPKRDRLDMSAPKSAMQNRRTCQFIPKSA